MSISDNLKGDGKSIKSKVAGPPQSDPRGGSMGQKSLAGDPLFDFITPAPALTRHCRSLQSIAAINPNITNSFQGPENVVELWATVRDIQYRNKVVKYLLDCDGLLTGGCVVLGSYIEHSKATFLIYDTEKELNGLSQQKLTGVVKEAECDHGNGARHECPGAFRYKNGYRQEKMNHAREVLREYTSYELNVKDENKNWLDALLSRNTKNLDGFRLRSWPRRGEMRAAAPRVAPGWAARTTSSRSLRMRQSADAMAQRKSLKATKASNASKVLLIPALYDATWASEACIWCWITAE
ncbi:hypothetical protein B0H14DRAFT_2556947 [Mycena olivaceomarginata]|nr:hypothetical protein B0H14DRAFT_2556947 [Mycena olivaceomarginata]